MSSWLVDPGVPAVQPCPPRRVVVGAAILHEGRLLAARRRPPSRLAGGWELPGGKVEAGESDENAIIREIREELGVEIALSGRVHGEWELGRGMVRRVFIAVLVAGDPEPLADHDELRWLTPNELYDVAWLPADRPAVELVQSRTNDLRAA
jgi:8-oxo-dGTP diphosphatase